MRQLGSFTSTKRFYSIFINTLSIRKELHSKNMYNFIITSLLLATIYCTVKAKSHRCTEDFQGEEKQWPPGRNRAHWVFIADSLKDGQEPGSYGIKNPGDTFDKVAPFAAAIVR